MSTVVYTIIAALIVSSLLFGLRATALKNSYDSTAAFTVNDTAGVVHTVAASGISGDTVALLYGLAAGLVWLIAIVIIVMTFVKKLGHA